MGAKASPSINLVDKEGSFIHIALARSHKTVPAMVVTSDSEAKRQGNDLGFVACSQACAEALKAALQAEIDLLDSLNMG